MSYLKCEKCSGDMRCMAGCSAHPNNWYCERCDAESESAPQQPQPAIEEWKALFNKVALSLGCLPSAFLDDNQHVLDAAMKFAVPIAQPAAVEGVPIELSGIAEALKEGSGFWHECSGCFEAGEYGENTHNYPHSKIFQCRIGSGCDECGGIGAVWDNPDYDAMAEAMLNPSPAGVSGGAVPEGFVLVPIEPTEEMQTAGGSSIRFDTTPANKLWTANSVYKAMLSAAQSQGDAK